MIQNYFIYTRLVLWLAYEFVKFRLRTTIESKPLIYNALHAQLFATKIRKNKKITQSADQHVKLRTLINDLY